jgi:redox-sensing transcriptional repressor
LATISSEELAKRGATTSAQVRKDLSFFGSFGKRGLGYSVPELAAQLRQILGLERTWSVVIVGAGKIGSAMAQYRGFRQRGFTVVAVYDSDPAKIGSNWDGITVRDIAMLERDSTRESPDIAVLATPAEHAQKVAERIAKAGIRAILNFAPVQLQLAPEVTVKNVNMALELEGLSFALTNRD